MNGLKSWIYFLAHYVDFLLSAIASIIIFLLVAAAFRLEIVSINPGPIIIVLIVWVNTAISLSFAISTIFGNARNALVGTFLVLLMSIVISIAATAIWNNDPPSPYFIWPPFACYTAVGIINSRAVGLAAPALTASTMSDGGKLLTTIYYMVVEWAIFLLIAIYGHVHLLLLEAYLTGKLVIQTEYGVSRPWYWPAIAPFEKLLRKREIIGPPSTQPDLEASTNPQTDKVASNSTTISAEGDHDVASERERITSGSADDSALVISLARKRFGKKLAVRDVSVAVAAGEILALLGPNGAGKTTLVNCVLGLYRLSSGSAVINGFNIMRQQDQVYRYVGICPQHEILWPDLTCEEHLLFYARLKGVDKTDEKEVVEQCLEQVELFPEGRKLAKQLSGGQRRRLAIAIALVARPTVVFLDEPTTGISP